MMNKSMSLNKYISLSYIRMNKNLLKTFAGSVFALALIIVALIMIDKATASSGYSCGGRKEMYKQKAPIPEDKMRRIKARRKRMRKRQKKMYR
jgi:hypothetical protein